MILNKKGLAVLPLAALLFTSCSKSMSFDQAVEFVKTNYTSTEQKTPKKTVLDVVGTASNDEAKAFLKQMYPSLDDNLKYHEEKTEGLYPMSVLKAEDLDYYKEYGDAAIFSAKGKQLTITVDIKATVGKVESGEKYMNLYNDNGYLTKGEMSGSYKDPTMSYTLTQTMVYEY